MGDVVAFLNARLDEAETRAREMEPEVIPVYTGDPERPEIVIVDEFIKREFREIEAKRKILSMYQDAVAEASSEVVEWMLAVVETEARVYSDHPNFDPAWAAS
jgi:hypothetical protein